MKYLSEFVTGAILAATLLFMGWQAPRVVSPEDQLRMEMGKLNANMRVMTATLKTTNDNTGKMNKLLDQLNKAIAENNKELQLLIKLFREEGER